MILVVKCIKHHILVLYSIRPKIYELIDHYMYAIQSFDYEYI
jgi:hypothetical protein